MPQSPVASQLAARLTDRSAVLAIIGLGYVGLPLVRAFHDRGFRVLGYDIDSEKIEALRAGQPYIRHLAETFATLAASDRFTPTDDGAALRDADVILLCVPTPLTGNREPDLSAVIGSTDLVAAHLRPGQLVVLESTTYPGTTRDEVLPRLEAGGLRRGRDFFVAFSPEREDPGTSGRSAADIPKVVGGIDALSTDLAVQFYEHLTTVHRAPTAEVAEASKLLENIYRAVNIALVNELKGIFGAMDIDVWDVIEASSTKPFGFQPFYPGPGLGGHCIPIDPFYLAWKARGLGQPTKFIELAGEINATMPARVITRLGEALNEFSKPLRDSKILILGVAYKKNIDDIRETPAAAIIEQLLARGAVVRYHDPHIATFPPMRHHAIHLESVPLNPETIRDHDCVLIVTAHDAVDYGMVGEHAHLIIDTRNAMADIDPVRAPVVKA